MLARILIADDDVVQRHLVENMVQRFGYEPVVAESGDEAIAILISSDTPMIDAVVLDLIMPGLDGMGVLARIRDAGIDIPVIVQTTHGGIDNAVSAIRAGAQDFVVKPVGAERLRISLHNALNTSALKRELQRMKYHRDYKLTFQDIIARSESMNNVLQIAMKAANSSSPVLIEGEPGVGKELIARAIHGSSNRSGKPFVAVNCGMIPNHCMESILFGCAKGEKHAGNFVEASGGTLFLEEVHKLPPSIQVKILRVLQEGEVEVVGARKPLKIDVRIISATSCQLLDHVRAGYFREDLFYRLHMLSLTVPPLRARREDIPYLLRHFLARFCAEEKRQILNVEAQTIALLSQAHWPGNVRQLETIVHRAVIMSDNNQLTLSDFPQVIRVEHDLFGKAVRTFPDHTCVTPESSIVPAVVPGTDIPIVSPMPSPGNLVMLTADGEIRSMDDMEAEIIHFAISYYHGQMSEVARRLKIGRSTLYRKLDEGNREQAASNKQ